MPTIKKCPRCGATFECRHDSILTCHCASVKLTDTQLKYIQSHYTSCLCHQCLLEIPKWCKDETDAEHNANPSKKN